PPGLDIGRLDDEPLDLHSSRGKPEILGGIERELGDERVVLVRELARADGGSVGGNGASEDFGGAISRVTHPRERASSLVEGERHVVVIGDDRDGGAGDAILQRYAKQLVAGR